MDKAAYLELLAPIVAEYRNRSHRDWIPLVSGEPIVSEIMAPDGTRCSVEISALWDEAPGGNIRVLFSIDDGGWRAWSPVSDCFIIAPDNNFVGE